MSDARSKTGDVELGKRLRLFRLDNHISQEEIAATLGVSQGNLSAIETGRTALTTDNAKKIANRYFINLNWLIGGVGPQVRQEASMLAEPVVRYSKPSALPDPKSNSQGYIDHLEQKVAFLEGEIKRLLS